ncbi:MAG TPA: hypothetical protein PKK95_08965 [Vicinamibacterales bacterium]|nr:hypothetical protein [Acidobacteriota bacterium]HOC18385.1 hypothetical protein [Vicinamibacterales bacterium]
MHRSMLITSLAFLLAGTPLLLGQAPTRPPRPASDLFRTSDGCQSCHNQLTGPGGEDVSIGTEWRASIMANASRDPYWHGAVRREILDHPDAQAQIEHECSICHMPMTNYAARVAGGRGSVFAHLPIGSGQTPDNLLAADGVSCTVCHQVMPEKLGTRDSFTGGYVVDAAVPYGQRAVYGPFDVKPGMAALMRSSAEFTPTRADHLNTSEMCATCHTLYTHALGKNGEVIGELPEQVPYLEWRHSAFAGQRTCQSCHMPTVKGPLSISSTLGEMRPSLSRHEFRGANFFTPRLLNRYAAYLGVAALPQELDAASRRAADYLVTEAATLAVGPIEIADGRLKTEVVVENLGGHKLPTAYPSRRAWLHLTVRDEGGRMVFESGALETSGAIRGNDNDADPLRYEPHYREITAGGEVQIYEAIMADQAGAVTTGLLKGVRYLKDNRILPRGFDKATAVPDIAVRGPASADEDFQGGSDRVRLAVDLGGAQGPFTVEAELWYQPVGFRWARNLETYQAPEPQRFVRMYDGTAGASAVMLARVRVSGR